MAAATDDTAPAYGSMSAGLAESIMRAIAERSEKAPLPEGKSEKEGVSSLLETI